MSDLLLTRLSLILIVLIRRCCAGVLRGGVVVEAYSPLAPLMKFPGGALDIVVQEVAGRLGRTPAQVLLRWCVQQGIVAVTTSRSEERQREFLDVVGFVLEEGDMRRVGEAGVKEHHRGFLAQGVWGEGREGEYCLSGNPCTLGCLLFSCLTLRIT
ncbi:hypothetical protein L873DRAFT_853569 [Choiromyces venosus 120613-1]|uniref:NADP-dependent oxidoreductase domain-containing protein n=1 Tax=Choiromyces venosus 120613-1 TaxID=1336337 RepID=A0A3N4JS55_9PEZI|nr:hypothetical protein L873DRAFT_853569 [Choiromyces venosus 120613-1]